jgi:Flp pilus assembly secretin CpaC
MTASADWHGYRAAARCAAIVIAAVLAIAPLSPARAVDPAPVGTLREPVTVHLDQAKLLKLPDRTATLVLGNPLIADAVVQPGGVVVVTAKSYGMTNLVALDRTGNTLGEYPIQVVGPSDTVVVVYRGIERESYSCAPNCERRITIGDTPNYLTQNLATLGTYNAQAQGQQQQQK